MDAGPPALANPPLGVAVALGVGLPMGVERERRNGEQADREAAGLRSFALACATGAVAQWLPAAGLVAAGAVFVAVLAAVSHWKSRSRDPGLTTELALFTTYLIGVQAVISPALGAAFGVALAALLAARDRLHRFATRWLSEHELHDGLLLAALALIVLPLIPSRPIAALGAIGANSVTRTVVAVVAGGPRFALRIVAALASGWGLAALAAWAGA